jgi:hypothetical protein
MELCSSGVSLKLQPSFSEGYLNISVVLIEPDGTHAGQADSVRTFAVKLPGSLYAPGFFERAV